MGAREKMEVEELLEELKHEFEKHAARLEPREHLRTMWMVRYRRYARPASPVTPSEPTPGRIGRKPARIRKFGESLRILDALAHHANREDFRTALMTLVLYFTNYVTGTHIDPARVTKEDSKALVSELEARVEKLEARVERLEQGVELPFQPFIEEANPFELLQQLRDELGNERFSWFTTGE